MVAAARGKCKGVEPTECARLGHDIVDVRILAIERPAARVPHVGDHEFSGAHTVEQLILVVEEEAQVALAGGQLVANLFHEGGIGLGVVVERERILAHRKGEAHEDWPAQAERGTALQIRAADIGVVGDVAGEFAVGDDPVRAP
jgi:hypothetical protein